MKIEIFKPNSEKRWPVVEADLVALSYYQAFKGEPLKFKVVESPVTNTVGQIHTVASYFERAFYEKKLQKQVTRLFRELDGLNDELRDAGLCGVESDGVTGPSLYHSEEEASGEANQEYKMVPYSVTFDGEWETNMQNFHAACDADIPNFVLVRMISEIAEVLGRRAWEE